MTSDGRGIYLAGPVKQDDDPESWRDEIKLRFPHVDFIDPMGFQEDWDDDPVGVIERELQVCETHPILVCNIGSNAPETVGTHHEISHALANGNDRIAVVPEGDVAGFIEHRVTTFDSAEMAVNALTGGQQGLDRYPISCPECEHGRLLVADGVYTECDNCDAAVPRTEAGI